MFLTSNCHFQLKYKSSIHNIALSSHLVWIKREICTNQAPASENSLKEFSTNMLVDFDVRGQQGMDFFHWRKRYYRLWIGLYLELSFWRHPFTAGDPLVSKLYNTVFLRIYSNEETKSSTSWMAWGWVHFQQIFIFGWNIPLNFVLSMEGDIILGS